MTELNAGIVFVLGVFVIFCGVALVIVAMKPL